MPDEAPRLHIEGVRLLVNLRERRLHGHRRVSRSAKPGIEKELEETDARLTAVVPMTTGGRVVIVAIVAGLGLSFFFTRLPSGMLFGVSPADPAVLGSVAAT